MNYPAGEHVLKETIHLDKNGSNIHGVGSSLMSNNGLRGEATWLAYDGPIDKPALWLTGCEATLRDFSVNGLPWEKYRLKTHPRPSCGLLVQRISEGLPTGRNFAERIHVSNFDTGLQIGTTPGEHQCAESDWISMSFSDCGTAVRQIPGQAIGHTFRDYRGYNNDVDFEINGGGKLLVDGMFRPLPGTMIKINPGDKKFSIGHNVNYWEFRHLYLDNQAGESLILDMADAAYWGASTLLLGAKISHKNYLGGAIRVGGDSSVTIRDFDRLDDATIVGGSVKYPTRVLVENCALSGVKSGLSLFKPDAGKKIRAIIRDCYDAVTLAAIPNTSRVVQG